MSNLIKLDADLDKIIGDLWKKNPHPDYRYANVVSKLLIVQELRNLKKVIMKAKKWL